MVYLSYITLFSGNMQFAIVANLFFSVCYAQFIYPTITINIYSFYNILHSKFK